MLRNINPIRDNELEPLKDPGQVSGFASPASDYMQSRLHIIQKIVKDPTNTFYFEMKSDELKSLGIIKDALLVVDRSVKPTHGSTVVVNYEGEWIVKQLVINRKGKSLGTGMPDDERIVVGDQGIQIFGVVTWSCNPMANLVKHIFEEK